MSAWLHVCLCTVCMLAPAEDRKGFQMPWNWSDALLLASTWVLRTQPKSSGKPSVFNH